MKPRKLAKRIARLERKVKALEKARMWEPLPSAQVDGPEFDPQELWLIDHVVNYMHGEDDGEDWSNRGYL